MSWVGFGGVGMNLDQIGMDWDEFGWIGLNSDGLG